jgi:hypothetical protein
MNRGWCRISCSRALPAVALVLAGGAVHGGQPPSQEDLATELMSVLNTPVVGAYKRAQWCPPRLEAEAREHHVGLAKENTHRLTPRLSLFWDAGPAQEVKVILGQGFRLPTVSERNDGCVSSQEPNPTPKPEIMTSEQPFGCWKVETVGAFVRRFPSRSNWNASLSLPIQRSELTPIPAGMVTHQGVNHA